ncbi:MAG: hypothetical protein ACE5FT_00545 [Candidatus Nanoarchaeia archaeon]
MKRLLAVLLVVCLLFAVGCAKEEPTPEPEPAPAPAPVVTPPAPEPVEPKAEGGEVLGVKSSEGIGAGVTAGDGTWLSDVKCGKGLLTFTVSNPTEKELVFRRIRTLEASDYDRDQIAKVLVNGRHFDSVEGCGLGEKDGMLQPGESMDCRSEFTPDDLKSPVLIRTGLDDLGEPIVNNLKVQAGASVAAEFVCEGGEAEVAEAEE